MMETNMPTQMREELPGAAVIQNLARASVFVESGKIGDICRVYDGFGNTLPRQTFPIIGPMPPLKTITRKIR